MDCSGTTPIGREEKFSDSQQYGCKIMLNKDMHIHKNVDKDTLKVYYVLRLRLTSPGTTVRRYRSAIHE